MTLTFARTNVAMLGLAVVSLLMTPHALAVPITGTMAFNGDGPVFVDFDVIDFQNPVNPDGDGTGSFTVIGGSTGVFVPLVGSGVTIRDLNRTDVPVGATVNYTNFVTFALQPTWSITLTELLPGVFGSSECLDATPDAGDTCTPDIPGGSPFNLINTSATSSTVSFNFRGFAVDSTTPELVSEVLGLFTAPFSDKNLQQVLAEVFESGVLHSDAGSLTASFVPGQQDFDIPEPQTADLILVGGLLFGSSAFLRRFRRT